MLLWAAHYTLSVYSTEKSQREDRLLYLERAEFACNFTSIFEELKCSHISFDQSEFLISEYVSTNIWFIRSPFRRVIAKDEKN